MSVLYSLQPVYRPKTQMTRIKHIDIAKGLGIILVVWGHSQIELGHYIIYMFHMPLFFYLSGIFHKPGAFNVLITRKFTGLIIPLLIFVILLSPLALFCCKGTLSFSPPHLKGIFGPLWFLISLFILSLIYHPLLDFRPVVRLSICITLSFVLGYLPSMYNLENYAYCFTTFSALIFYATGNIVGDRFLNMNKRFPQFLAFVVFAFSLIVMYYVCFKYMHYGNTDMYDNVLPPNFLLFVLSAAAGIGMVLSLSLFISRSSILANIMALIGECSMYIFAFHMAVFMISREYFPHHGLPVEFILIILSIAFGCCVRPVFKQIAPAIFK